MKQLMLIATLSVLLVSCGESIKGQLLVADGIDLVNKSGDLITIDDGIHNATFRLKSKKLAQIKLKNNGENETFNLTIPKGFIFPTQGGSILLSAEDIGQNYDLAAVVNKTVVNSDPITRWESCSKTRRVEVCEYVNGEMRCHWQTITEWGEQRVRFHWQYITRIFQVNFLMPEVETPPFEATFDGTKSTRHKIIEYKGRCRLHF